MPAFPAAAAARDRCAKALNAVELHCQALPDKVPRPDTAIEKRIRQRDDQSAGRQRCQPDRGPRANPSFPSPSSGRYPSKNRGTRGKAIRIMGLMGSTEGASRGCVSQADMTRAAQKGGNHPSTSARRPLRPLFGHPRSLPSRRPARAVCRPGCHSDPQQSKKGRPKAAVRGGAVGDCMTRRPLRRVSCACRGGAI